MSPALAQRTRDHQSSTTRTNALRGFGSEEHKELQTEVSDNANSNFEIANAPAAPDYLTFGDVVALSGPYSAAFDEVEKQALHYRLLYEYGQIPLGTQRIRGRKGSTWLPHRHSRRG